MAAFAIAAALSSAAPAALAGAAVGSGPTSIALQTPANPAEYNEPIVVEGSITPAAGGVEVALQRAEGAGNALATGTTADDGTFRIEVTLKESESLVARATDTGVLSAPIDVRLRPRLQVKVGKAAAFATTTVKITVDPHAAKGTARLTIKRNGKTVKHVRTKVKNEKATKTIVAPGPGSYVVVADFDAPNGYAAATGRATGKGTTRVIKVGSRGPDVAGLIRRLRALNFHTPPVSERFDASLTDSVIAFQKVAGLSRTGVMGQSDWLALAKANPVRATRKGPPNRIEVDITRQILIKVRGGKVIGVLPVSTGSRGNTPVGVHNIRWKAPSTTTWLGPGILYRTLTFWEKSFAIHGWKSVPAYPASAGCVRIPIWAADWLYDRSPVGETVIVHR